MVMAWQLLSVAAEVVRVVLGEEEMPLPRVAIKFCVQCKWNLRAAYVRIICSIRLLLGQVCDEQGRFMSCTE